MIFRVSKDKANPYVMINKQVIYDPNISLKAKGIIIYMLSRPDNWQIYEIEIIKHCKDGRDSIRSGIKELIDKGYITRQQRRDNSGQFKGYEYTVFETPQITVVGKSDNGKSNTSNNEITKYRNEPNILDQCERQANRNQQWDEINWHLNKVH